MTDSAFVPRIDGRTTYGKLVKDGMLEALFDEDGEIKFRLTEKGRQLVESLPQRP